jgi:trans-2,3-dihydro-3-hydroxyanthranilate isomerase
VLGTNTDFHTVAELMGLAEADLLLNGLPMQIVSTGLPDLMVPVRDLPTLKKARPDFSRLAAYQKQQGFISIHAFTFETEDPGHTLHVRDFAPSVDINEEAATGTANGALGAYLVVNRALPLSAGKLVLQVEQGYAMGRPSEIVVEITHDNGVITDVKVGGRAVIIMEGIFIF